PEGGIRQMNDGNHDAEKWQWVDEDPFEKLLAKSRSADEADSPAPAPQSAPQLPQSPPPTPPPQSALDWAATVATNVVATPIESDSARLAVDTRESAAAFDLAVSLQKAEKWDAAANSFRKCLDIEPGRV